LTIKLKETEKIENEKWIDLVENYESKSLKDIKTIFDKIIEEME
jgi:hypothetical protein